MLTLFTITFAKRGPQCNIAHRTVVHKSNAVYLGLVCVNQILTTHDVSHHMYVDDTPVFIEVSQSDTHKSIPSLIDCLTDISLWKKSSKHKLSYDNRVYYYWHKKSEQQLHILSNHFPVKLLDNDISPSDSVRNLGVIFDSDFSFQNTFPMYASHAFTTYVIYAEFVVTYLYPPLRQCQML